MFKRALRHRDPMLRSPKKMLFVVVTLATVPAGSSWKLIGGCGLPDYLMLWFLWPSSLDLGLGLAGGWDGGSCAQRLRLVQPPLKRKESDCLGCCWRNEPEDTVTMYPGETLALFKLWVFNWLLSSCSARATFLLAGIDRFVGDLVAAQSWCEEDHLSGLVIEVFESILACTCTFL